MIQELSSEEVNQLYIFRNSIAQFRVLLDTLPADERSMEHNKQFNELRSEAQALLKTPFTENVPRAITGNTNTDRSISAIVVVGALLALVGFGINSLILEDLIVNSLGCCISSGGLLLVIGAFVVLAMKNVRERVTSVTDLSYQTDLLLYQVDHRLAMIGQQAAQPPQPAPASPKPVPPPPANLAPPE
jgi:hypothetical protein